MVEPVYEKGYHQQYAKDAKRIFMSLLAAWFWPKVSDRENAQFAISEAFCVAVALSAIMAMLAAIEVLRTSAESFDAQPFLSPVQYAGLAFGIYRKSRIAAISALALYLVGRGYLWIKAGPYFGVIPVLITLAFLHGVRGTFAYQKLPPRPGDLPSLAQTFEALSHTSPENLKPARKTQEGNSADA